MGEPIKLWTEFNGQKLAAERARCDWNGNALVAANDATITVKVADASTGPTAGSFTTNQGSAGTITIPAAVSATNGGSATPGVMSAGDKEKLDSLEVYTVTDSTTNGNILVNGTRDIDVYTHPNFGPTHNSGLTNPETADVTAGETADRTLAFGGTFKVTGETVGVRGHTTALAEHTLTLPSSTATTSADGLMSSTDKTKLNGIETGAQANVKPDWDAAAGSAAEILHKPSIPTVNNATLSITVGSASAVTFTANASDDQSVSIPNAASASGGSAATGGLMTATDKANLDNATAVIPSTATSQNQLVDQAALSAAIADFGGYKTATGTGADLHPDVASPDTHFVYLVEDTSSTEVDKYKEWICTDATTNPPTWELIGDTTMDMDGYAQIPSGATDTHIVLFGPTSSDELVDSGTTVSQLENKVETITIGAGGTILTPTSGTTDIVIPLAANSSGTGTAGAMSGQDKVKLDGIIDYVVSASVSGSTLTLVPKTGNNVTFTAPSAAASGDTPVMDGTAAVGVSDAYARADHVHPSDSAKQDVLTFNTTYDPSSNKAATMSDISSATSGKADKVTSATSGHLAGLDGSGNLTDSGVVASDVITGVKLEGASSELTPVSGVVTIPNAIATGTSGASNGLMTASQAQMLAQIGAWTWSYATFSDSGMGTESTSTFPFTVPSA